jgi:hypothetical protein
MRRISFTHIYIFGIIMTLSEKKTQIARQLQTPGSSPPCGTDERRKVGKFSCPFVKNRTPERYESFEKQHDFSARFAATGINSLLPNERTAKGNCVTTNF